MGVTIGSRCTSTSPCYQCSGLLSCQLNFLLWHISTDIEAGEAGRGAHLYHVAPPPVAADLAAAVPQFVAILQLMCLGLVPLHVLRGGDHLLEAGAYQNHGPRWIPSLPSDRAKTDQGHRQEAQMEEEVWYHMKMVLLTQAKGEMGNDVIMIMLVRTSLSLLNQD